ncbi:3-oxoadipate enol-lactonase [uncultured Enterovirga sp.]|uniref:3-oxoadipate enol-lactonase n=1 Tax=uncultured Enterovirga sp. TaxID=2026352 RepID=UPI0035CAF931
MTMIDIPGGRLFSRVDGDADKPWLVLSNSLASDHTMWDPQMAALTARYRVLRYDTRGHGRSDAPPSPYGFPDLVSDVVTVMDAHGIRRAAHMGLSLGGMTGLGLALEHPDRVERLVCCDARADAPEGFVRSWDDRIAAVERGGMAALVDGTLDRWLTPAFRAAHPEEVAKLAAQIRATQPEGYKGCAAALKTLDYLKDLGRLALPVLYVVGAEDSGAPVPAMQAMADATPGARFEIVPNAAHIANVDNPKGFGRALEGFLL